MQNFPFVGRIVSSLARQHHSWNAYALTPIDSWGFDTYVARMFRYFHARTYYHNVAYTSLVSYADSHKADSKLYKQVRGIYNPVKRLIETYVSKCYGGSLDMEDATEGAVPIMAASEQLRDAIRQLWLWSNWGTMKALYVRTGALCGDTFLKVIDDPVAQKVRLEVVDPAKIKSLTLDEVGNIKDVVIEYEKDEEVLTTNLFSKAFQRRTHVYTEHITQERFETYRDGEPFAYYTDPAGQGVSAWDNEYGFIPMVLVRHQQLGADFGGNAFLDFVRKIDEINDNASLLNDQIRKTVQPIWWITGNERSEIDLEYDEKDIVPMIFGGENSDAKPMIANVQISSAIQNINNQLSELERDMPELGLYRLRDASVLTAPGVRAGWSDAIDRLTDANGNYDDGLVRAQMMAVSMGGLRRYDKFTPFSLDSYARGDLQHFIKNRPIINDSLSEKEKMDYLMTSGAPQRGIWRRLGIPDSEIQEWEGLVEDTQQPALDNQQADTALKLAQTQAYISQSQQQPQLAAGGQQ